MTPVGLRRLKDDEGLRLRPYRDPVGKLTVGYGRNLDAEGIGADEAALMLANDLDRVLNGLNGYTWFSALDPARQDVIINAAFNIGVAGLLGFHRMIAALEAADYETAAKELLDSAAARQLPSRYGRLAAALRTGTWLAS